MQMFFTSSHYLIKIMKTYCEKHLSIAVSVKTRKVISILWILCIKLFIIINILPALAPNL